MTAKGRDDPQVQIWEHESGEGVRLRVDFGLYPAGWVEVDIGYNELRAIEPGQVIYFPPRPVEEVKRTEGGE